MLCIYISSSIQGFSSIYQTPFNFEPGCWQVDAATLASPRKFFPGWDVGAQLQESCRGAALTGSRQRQLQAEMSFSPPPANQSCAHFTLGHRGGGGSSAVKSCCASPGQMATGLSPSPGWSLSGEGGRVDRQSWSQSRDHQQLWDRAASAAAPAAGWEWHPCLETQDFQICGEELSLRVQLVKITPFLLSYWKGEQEKGQEIRQIVLPGAVLWAPCDSW